MTAMKRQMGRPTLEEASALKEQLLGSALDMLCHRGISGLAMDALAAEAGVTKRTIYRHFESKMGLINAVVDREISRLTSAPAILTEGADDALMGLKAWSKSLFFLTMDTKTRQFGMFLSFERLTDPEIASMLQDWVVQVISPATDLVAKAQLAGQLRDGDPGQYTLLLMDLVQGPSHRMSYNFPESNVIGGLSEEAFFALRWAAFIKLAATDPWNDAIASIGGVK